MTQTKQIMLRKLANKIKTQPKYIFILDGFGAIFTAFSLGVVLVHLEDIFGIPVATLKLLSIFPLFYLGYDIFCFFSINNNIGYWLKGLAVLNCAYCPLSIGMAINDSQHLTNVGWIYIMIEIIVIVAIARYELELADKLIRKVR